MKFSIGTNIKEGPWGGGNLFAKNLIEYLRLQGHEVVNHLLDDDIDLILITEPRRTSESSAFTHMDVIDYLNYVKSETLIVHRINECDERKGTNFVNKYLIGANNVADQTVFVSDWLMRLYLDQGLNTKNNRVIMAGANNEIFNNRGLDIWNKNSKLKIVTHHWGANWNKGFDAYSKLDDLLSFEDWKEKIDFTYIGNLPKKFQFKNAQFVSPLSGIDLANKLKENHLYITGSLNEPSGNHHIEAAQCGLPLLYINSGGMPEYCADYGIEFNIDNLEIKLNEMMENYENYFNKLKDYRFNAEIMSREYEELFIHMIKNKEEYLSERTIDLKKNFIKSFFYSRKKSFKLKNQ